MGSDLFFTLLWKKTDLQIGREINAPLNVNSYINQSVNHKSKYIEGISSMT